MFRSFNNIIARTGLIFSLFFLFIPVIFSNELPFGVLSAKYFALVFFSFIGLPVVCSLSLFPQKLSFSKLDVAVLVFITYLLLHDILDNDPDINRKSMYFGSSAIAYLIYRAVYERYKVKYINYYSYVAVAVVIVAILTSLLQYTGHIRSFNDTFPITSTFFHPAIFAGFLGILFPLFLYFFLLNIKTKTSRITGFFWLLVSLGMLFSVIFIGNRGALLGLFGGTFFLGAPFLFRKLFQRKMPFVKIALFILVFSLCLLFAFYKMYSVRPESVHGRMLVWKISAGMISDKPMLGVGPGNFRNFYPQYQIRYFKEGEPSTQDILLSDQVTTPFNEVLAILCELGFIGLLLFLLIIYIVFFKKPGTRSKEGPDLGLALKGCIFSFLLYALFEYPFSLPELVCYFFILLALSGGDETPSNHPMTLLAGRSMALFVCIFLVLQFPRFISEYDAEKKWFSAATHRDILAAQELFHSIYPKLKRNDNFLTSYAYSLQQTGNTREAIRMLNLKKSKMYEDYKSLGDWNLRLSNYLLAEDNYFKALYLLPHRFSPRFSLLKLYLENVPDTSKAMKMADDIIKMPVKVESKEVEQIRNFARSVLR